MSEKPPASKNDVPASKNDVIELEAKPVKPSKPVQEVIDYASSFMSLSLAPQGKYRLKRGVDDLMHTMGHYVEQTKGGRGANRLDNIVAALKHISDNLTKD